MARKASVNDHQKANSITVEPRNKRQADYIRSIETSAQTFALGPAGTGKTFLAAITAAKLYLRGDVSRIILMRPVVGVGGEKLGFLPGNANKKLEPWARPFVEELKQKEVLGPDKVDTMIQQRELEIIPFEHVQGLTFRDSIVVLDEAENTSVAQMKQFVTRLGEGSRYVIDGDLRQSQLREKINGLSWAVRMVREYGLSANVIEFLPKDVVRSGVVAEWVDAIEKDEGEADMLTEDNTPAFLRLNSGRASPPTRRNLQ